MKIAKTANQRRAICYTMLGIFIAILFSALILIPIEPSQKSELQTLQIEATKLRIKLLKRQLDCDVLTINDLDSIYDCVNIKIKNKNSKFKFPCIAVRGEPL